MRCLLLLGLCIFVVQQSVAPPVKEKKKEKDEKEENEEENVESMDHDKLEYSRYLKEVVEVLESDPEFRKKLQEAKEEDVRSGKIAHELEYANHNVRTKLDEIKRREIERLRHLATKEFELENGLDIDHMKIPEHLDHENPHSFEIDDLKKLIAQTTKDLNDADEKRREQFKAYEMQKKFEQEQKLKELDEEARKKYAEEVHQMEEKHKKHDPLHHPGSKQQLEEVWEKQDHMESQDFDPKTFFYLHDLDGNGAWDQNEVKALFRKELDKLYAEGHPEDDLLERAEEMERMREHVFKEADLNKDGLISFNEFLQQTKRPDFQKDEGWETLDEQQIYSKEEYEEFEKRRQEEIQRMVAKGMLPPHQDVYGYPHQFPQHNAQVPPQGQPQQYVPHPNQQVPYHGQPIPQQQYPPQYQQQAPQQYQQYQQQVNQPQGQMPQQIPPQGIPPQQIQPQGQAPQQYPPPGQVPQQYSPPGQVPQQYSPPGQVPLQGQAPLQGQVPIQGQAAQYQTQGQVPQQYSSQGQAPQYQPPGQVPQYQPPGQVPQYQTQGQAPQQAPTSAQVPEQVVSQGQVPQQVPLQGQPPQQVPLQGQPPQQVPLQGQVPQQVPLQGQVPQQNPPLNVPAPNSIPPVANKV
ncbi:nucleobindin-2 isoform X2 [Belonocnema kinseyi]|uniref:nucleobindin-2 isoform X2 n=1 Tax=Belonocnema kinseyi TaxID=2817044 RepID=UPI00143CCA19|nr:nucleobindin-2 isoform X2 [Belonocnema kinseyi]